MSMAEMLDSAPRQLRAARGAGFSTTRAGCDGEAGGADTSEPQPQLAENSITPRERDSRASAM